MAWMRPACSSMSLTMGREGWSAGISASSSWASPSTPVSGLLISCATPAPSEPMAASERERKSRSCASRSSLVFSSTRFSRVSFQATISSVWRRISVRAASSEVAMALKALASSPSSSLVCTSRWVSSRPWAILRAPSASAPTRPERVRASAAPTTAATRADTLIQ